MVRWLAVHQQDYLAEFAKQCAANNRPAAPLVVGVETISAGLSEPRDAIEDIIEPYLIQQGFIQRTPRGRVLTANAWRHLGLEAPKDLAQQINLFREE